MLVGIVVIGNDNFATTEFMGQYVRRILTAVNDYEDEFNLCHEIMMRVRQEERNGHLVWRAYLVTREKRKEVLMD